MTRALRFLVAAICAVLAAPLFISQALAGTCSITGASVTSISPSSSPSIGTYTSPTALSPVSVTVNLTVAVTLGGGGTHNCNGGVAFYRTTSATGTLTRSGGGSTIPYALTTTGGTNVISLSGSTPANGQFAFFTSNVTTGNTSFSASGTFTLQGNPTGSPLSGNYSDTNLSVIVFNASGSGGSVQGSVFAATGTSPTITGAVSTSCSIVTGSLQNASQVIGVNGVGQTTGMSTAMPQFSITCNNSSTVSLTSANSAVTRGGVLKSALPAISNFRNKIDYSASINGGAGAVTLNTATASTASGTFNAASVTSLATTVTLTPETSTVPLQYGSYADKLTITVTPN